MELSEPLREYTLLTGATGLLGGHLLADMLRAELPVAVIARPSATASSEQRVEEILRRFETQSGRLLSRPVVLSGHLCEPAAGLSPEHQNWIAAHCGRILHCAAHLSFRPAASHPDNEPYRTNVQGTQILLELARQARITEFHHVSTAYICGDRRGLVREDETEVGQSFGNDYEHSKLQAEEILRQATFLRSLTIYRPSIVIDGSGPPMPDRTVQQTYLIYRALRQQLGDAAVGDWFSTLGLQGEERKNFVHADWVSRVMVQILRRPALYGVSYHLTSAVGATITEMTRGFEQAYDERSHAAPTRSGSDVSANRRQGFLNTAIRDFRDTFSPYFRDDPVFHREHLDRALAICGEAACPEVGVAELKQAALQSYAGKPVVARDQSPQFEGVHQLRERQALQGRSAPSAHAYDLTLYGPGGGTYSIDPHSEASSAIQPRWSGEDRTHIVARASDFERLLRRELSWESAKEGGLLLVESNGPAHSEAQLSQFVAQLGASLNLDSAGSSPHRGMEVGSAD